MFEIKTRIKADKPAGRIVGAGSIAGIMTGIEMLSEGRYRNNDKVFDDYKPVTISLGY